MEKTIELTPLAEFGKCRAKVTDSSVEIETVGVNGGMKVWLVGGSEAEKLGNVVGGRLVKNVDTTHHNGILITQSGRQMFIGKYNGDVNSAEMVSSSGDEFVEISGIKLKKVVEKSFEGLGDELKYILSNRKVFQNYRKHGCYYVCENRDSGALAFKYEESDENPLAAFSDMCVLKNGYIMVCIDKKTKKFRKI